MDVFFVWSYYGVSCMYFYHVMMAYAFFFTLRCYLYVFWVMCVWARRSLFVSCIYMDGGVCAYACVQLCEHGKACPRMMSGRTAEELN